MAKELSLEEKMKTMSGYCCSCGTVIMDLTKKRPSERLLPNHRQHTIELSNGYLTVGVCEPCKVELVSGKAKKVADTILENHKIYVRNREGVNAERFEKVTVVNPNSSYFEYRLQRDKARQDHKIAMKELSDKIKSDQKTGKVKTYEKQLEEEKKKQKEKNK